MAQTQLDSRVSQYCFLFLTAVAFTFALIYTKPVLLPFVFSIFFFAVASPVVHWLQRKLKFPRWWAVATVFIGVAVICAVLTAVILVSVEDFVQGADVYKDSLVQASIGLVETASTWGYQVDKESVLENIRSLPIFSMVKQITGKVAALLGNVFLILIFVLFLLAGEQADKKDHPVLEEVLQKVSGYLVVKFLLSAATGFGVALVLFSFGVELAALLGLLTFLLNFIPNVGSLIATLLPIPLVLLEYGIGERLIGVVVLSMLIQGVIGNVVEPRIIGESMDLHPVTLLIFLMFWGLVWGVAGMFLAVPITAIMKIAMSRFAPTRPAAELMAGRI